MPISRIFRDCRDLQMRMSAAEDHSDTVMATMNEMMHMLVQMRDEQQEAMAILRSCKYDLEAKGLIPFQDLDMVS